MDATALLLTAGFAVAAAGLGLLAARGLVSPRQFALAMGGLACGAAVSAACLGGGHG